MEFEIGQKQRNYLMNVIESYPRDLNIPTEVIYKIQDIIGEALKDVTDYAGESLIKQKTVAFKDVDTVIFGDVHGELRLFVQNLYLSGVIDKNGNYDVSNRKTVIQLGDIVDRGEQTLESVIYSRMLQNQAREAGKEVNLLFGNHERFLFTDNWWNENRFMGRVMRPAIRSIVMHDIERRNLKIAYAHDSLRLLCFHGRVSKRTILMSLAKMYEEPGFRDKMDFSDKTREFFRKIVRAVNSLEKNEKTGTGENLVPFEKFSSVEIYKNLALCGISTKNISDWLNEYCRDSILKSSYPFNDFLKENMGVYCRDKKVSVGRGFVIPEIATTEGYKYAFKPIQIGGHTPTSPVEESRQAKGVGFGIKQDRASIYADADLVNGFQAVVGVDSKSGEVFALEIREDNGNIQLELAQKNRKVNTCMKRDSSKNEQPTKDFYHLLDKANFIFVRRLSGFSKGLISMCEKCELSYTKILGYQY